MIFSVSKTYFLVKRNLPKIIYYTKTNKDEINFNNSFFNADDDDSEWKTYISECDKILETVDEEITDEEDSDNESIVSILPT